MRLSSTTLSGVADPRSTTARRTAAGRATHNLTLYRHASGALVFGAGTVQWSWGLDANHDRGSAAGRHAHAAGDGQSAGRHGRAAGHAADRAWCRRRHRPTPLAPTSTITSPAAGRVVPAGAADHDHRHGDRQRRRRRSGRRGVGRRRRHVAPGAGHDELELHWDRVRRRAQSRSRAARSTTAATPKSRQLA